jgi:hypothetical protein
MKQSLASKPPDSERSVKTLSSKRKTTLFTRNWCFVAFDEVHEYRGERSRQFVGAVEIAKCAVAAVGISATPVLSNAKVSLLVVIPDCPFHCQIL